MSLSQYLRAERIFAFVIVIALATMCLGQTFTSSITGTVADPSGAAVSGASVQLRNIGNNAVSEATSSEGGTYQFNNLNPGTYEITVTAQGFKTYVKSNLILQAQLAASVNIPLELGNTQQKVEVTGTSVLVDTETANTSVSLDSRLISALPNSTRNPLNFVFAVAGTTEAPGGQTQRSGSLDQMSSNFGLNGGRTGDETILIDGAPSQAVDWGGLMVSPLQDSVQEQQILQNTYDAQYERGGAGIVTLVTKGGTNSFHGEIYDYLQNSALNANSWSNNKYGLAKGPFKQNQFGGNVGGPILKRANLFFFGGYEGLRQPNTQSSGLLTVPTAAERAGDFSSTLNPDGTPDLIYNPFTTTQTGSGSFTRQPFAGNVIPSQFINPVGQKIVSLYPEPNRTGFGPNNLNNYYAQGGGNTLNDKMDARVDWEQSAQHRMFVRWSDRFRQDITVPCFFCNGADQGNNQSNNGFQVVLNDTVTPSSSWVVNTYVSYSRWQEEHIAQGYGVADAATIGLSPALFQAPILPTISDNDGRYTGLGNSSFQKYVRYSDTIQMNLTKNFSKHTLRFGGNFDNMQINSVTESVGSFSFSSALTSCDPSDTGVCGASNLGSVSSGNAIASMLLGTGSGGGQGINIDPAMTLHSFGLYAQDQWRINSRLTFNFGLRWENQRPATERFNRLMFFDTNATNPISAAIGTPLKGEFQYAGVNGNNRYAWQPNNKDFAPRAGIAWKITDRLVARVGAGIFYLPPSAMISFDGSGQFYGFSSTTSYNATDNNGYTPLNLVSNPFPFGISQPQGSSQGGLSAVGNGLSQIWPKGSHPTPYSEDWSFNLQYQIGPRSVLQVGYSGNRGRKLLYGNPNLNADQLGTQYLGLGDQLNSLVNNPFYGVLDPSTSLGSQQQIPQNQLLRPYPQYTDLTWTRSLPGARSSFNALNVKYNYSFSSGLSLLATYQWSKALDNGPEDYFGWATGNTWRDAYNTKLDYNISTHDVPQSFTTALVYELPYGRGKHWGNSAPAVVKEVLGNWQVSTVVRLTSGLPIGPVVANPNNPLSQYGFPGSQLPNMVLGQSISPSNRNADNWVNAAAFSTAIGTYSLGNAPQRMSQLRERASRNVDLSVAKNFGGERFQAWLRGEFLNTFNYAQYNNFCLDLTQSSCQFGAATGTENQPRTVQLSLKLQF
ncbi:MAG: hypothetical protein JWP08_3547 [Bryobacterales bacterium]|nr:hypothetical protein [Bryobacterales bacterium]